MPLTEIFPRITSPPLMSAFWNESRAFVSCEFILRVPPHVNTLFYDHISNPFFYYRPPHITIDLTIFLIVGDGGRLLPKDPQTDCTVIGPVLKVPGICNHVFISQVSPWKQDQCFTQRSFLLWSTVNHVSADQKCWIPNLFSWRLSFLLKIGGFLLFEGNSGSQNRDFTSFLCSISNSY